MDLVTNTLNDFYLTNGVDNVYWIGFSGGLDSTVLLHSLCALRQDYPLTLKAVYINHGLSPHAEDWANHCEILCRLLQVDFITRAIEIKSVPKKSTEALARAARYDVFADLLQENDFLLTAHHQDDQAETVLLQLLRGAGPKGLAAMPRVKSFARGFHARPLLDFTRADLENYAHCHELNWIDDESNLNLGFTRNFLRHEVMPLLKTRWPSVAETLARVANNCAEAQVLMDSSSDEFLKSCQDALPQTINPLCKKGFLSVTKLLELDEIHQRHVLRAWLQQLNFPLPDAVKLQQIQSDILHAGRDKVPCLHWDGVEIRRYRDTIFAMPPLPVHDAKKTYLWDFKQPLLIPGIGELSAVIHGKGLRTDLKNVSIRFRQGGEKIKLVGHEHHRELKNLLQEWSVPPWQRDRIPLVFVEEKLAVVVGYGLSAEFFAENGWMCSLDH